MNVIKKECLIYMRTSTLTNKDGDSKHRQKSSIMKWVKDNGYKVKGEYFDIVSGKTDTMDRSEFLRIEDFTWRVSDCEELVGVTHRR